MMAAMTRIGAVFLPQLPPERLRAVAAAADEAGLEELWLWEDCFNAGAIASAAAALAVTRGLPVAVGLLPVPLRNVALTAMEVAALNRMFPGRVTVGVGHGVQDWMGQVGARVDSPVTLLREYATALRALLRGEKVTLSGRYLHLDRVSLDWPPAPVPPVLVGGVGDRTLRLTGEVGDGTILSSGTSPERVRLAREITGAQRARAGRPGAHPIVTFLHAATGPGAEQRLAAERLRWGYDTMDGRGVAGDAPAVAAAVRELAQAGADTVVLQPTPDDPDPEGFMHFVAAQVRALVP
jgi:alkanesulfonate monooxygenase SsuD/methylene tetrahydromethanopterin reductase-like flavin-dependent oxidoreductase (luciferase family)